MPLNQKKKKKNKLRKPLEANKRTSLRISTPPLSKLTPLTPPLTEKKAIKRSQKHVRRGEKKKKRRISQSLSSRAIRKESCSSRISNIEYIREYTRYLTAMSLFPRVNPTSSLKMKIRVAPRYHLMLWSPSHWGNFSTHGSCTSVPSSACFTLFSHGSLLPATTQRKRKKESSVNRPSFRFVFISFFAAVCFAVRRLFAKRMKIYGGGEGMIRWKKRDRFPRPGFGATVIKPSSRMYAKMYVYRECNFTDGVNGEGGVRSVAFVCGLNGGERVTSWRWEMRVWLLNAPEWIRLN